jgi:hypothetical protein
MPKFALCCPVRLAREREREREGGKEGRKDICFKVRSHKVAQRPSKLRYKSSRLIYEVLC